MSLSTRLPLLLVFASVMGLGYGGLSLSVNVLSSESRRIAAPPP